MTKGFRLLVALFMLVLQGCSQAHTEKLMPGVTESPERVKIKKYTDEEVQALIQRFPFVSTPSYGTESPDDLLERLGIDPATLRVLEHNVGDCYDALVYDLSPSYWLIVDRNACFGTSIWIRMKFESSDSLLGAALALTGATRLCTG